MFRFATIVRVLSLTTAALLPVSLAASDGRIPISIAPFTINAPGSYYVTRDLTVASGIAVNISANNVTLDLNGHTLTNTTTTANNWVIITNVAYSGVRVTGGRVVGGQYGVELEGSSAAQLQVDHLNVSGAGSYGVHIYSSGAVPATAIVEAVQVTGPAGTAGIGLQGVSGGRISGSSTQGCFDGILLISSRGVIVEDNTIAESGRYGINVTSNSSRDNIITRNAIQKALSTGIVVASSQGNRITFNIVGNGGYGIEVDNANNNTVTDNILTENSPIGIYLYNIANSYIARNNVTGTYGVGNGIQLLSSFFNTVDGNFSAGNVGYGLIFGNAGATSNIYSGNRLLNNVNGNNFGTGNVSAGGNNAGAANF